MPSEHSRTQHSATASEDRSLAKRLLQGKPLVTELVGLVFFVGGVLALEDLPVTYTREALGLAYLRLLATVLLISAVFLVILNKLARRRTGSERPPLRVEVAFFARVLPLLLFTMGVHFSLKGFILLMNPRQWDRELNALDTWFHLGISPGRFLTGLLASPSILRGVDFVYSGLYYVLIVLSVSALLTLPGLKRRLAFAAAFSWLWMSASIVYLAFPSWGPVFIWTSDFEPTLAHMPLTRTVQGLLFGELSSLVADPLGPRMTRFGCVAAFPSVHVAVVSLFTLASRGLSRVWFRCNLAILSVMIVGSVLTGYHYLVDAWAGLALATLCWWLGTNWSSRLVLGLDGATHATGQGESEASPAERGVTHFDSPAVVDDDLTD